MDDKELCDQNKEEKTTDNLVINQHQDTECVCLLCVNNSWLLTVLQNDSHLKQHHTHVIKPGIMGTQATVTLSAALIPGCNTHTQSAELRSSSPADTHTSYYHLDNSSVCQCVRTCVALTALFHAH